MAKKTIVKKLFYIGDGNRHLTGIPARDLTESDLAAMAPESVEDCLASGLYVKKAPKGHEPAKTATIEASEAPLED